MVRKCVLVALLVLLMAGPVVPTRGAEDPGPERVSAFYVGNWLINDSVPPFHDDLGESAGKEWTAGVRSGLNMMLYMNLYYFKHGWAYGDTPVWTTGGRGKLKAVFEGRPWDAMVVQPYGWVGLHRDKAQMGPWYTEKLENDLGTQDFGDVFSAGALFEAFLAHHPEGELIVLEGVPELPEKRGPDGEVVMQDTPAGPEPAPDREGYDYTRHWETVKYDPDQGDDGHTQSTRDYTRRLMEELKARFPENWREGKLRCIPVGEVYNALEKRIRAGDLSLPGGVTSFYSDTFHQRTGLPRYALAATMYATLFRDRPHSLDWSVYNDPGAYRQLGGPNWFYVHEPDLGEHLQITADLAEAVNDTIWQVVTEHPCARVDAD